VKTQLAANKIAFIGGGNMAEALVNGLLKSAICASGQMVVTDIRSERRAYLQRTYGVMTTGDNASAAKDTDILVLAVKPQVMDAVLDELNEALATKAVVISIAAGITTQRIEGKLGAGRRVVRVMPNTPALVGAGAAAICGGANATEADLAMAEELLGAVGLAVRVAERHLDAVTAVSGSGPAYVFLLMEAMMTGAEKLGLPADNAGRLIQATVAGAARLVAETGMPAATLREQVTSKGGTTAAALAVLEKRDVVGALVEAIETAERRSRELSSG